MDTYQRKLFFPILLLTLVFTSLATGEDIRYINDELPFFVQDSLLEYSDEIGDHNISGPIRKIYRKDLSPDYPAYYELQFGDQFFVFSSGPKTGDHRMVEHGKIPRPTDILTHLANKAGNICHKFFRLSPDGVTICENSNRKAVASTMDLKTETAGENSPNLSEEVKEDLEKLAEHWRNVAKKLRGSLQWKAIKIYQTSKTANSFEIVSKVLELGDSFTLPTGTSKLTDVEISVNYQRGIHRRGSVDLKALCSVLNNACSGSSTKVNIDHVSKANGYLRYIHLEVTNDYEFVKKTLQNKDIAFYVQLKIRGKTVVRKYFTIRLIYRQSKRAPWGTFHMYETHRYEIPYEYLMPNYKQHFVKKKGCNSGSMPVAWAQIFAYYDRMAHTHNSYGYSRSVYRGRNGHHGSVTKTAPSSFNNRARKFIEGLRDILKTRCDGKDGVTPLTSSSNLNDWFRKRQPNGKVLRLSSKDQVTDYVRQGYPVMNNIWWPGGYGKNKVAHSVVVTKVNERVRVFTRCKKVSWGWKKPECEETREYEREWYRRVGWGGSQNSWYTASLTSVFVAVH